MSKLIRLLPALSGLSLGAALLVACSGGGPDGSGGTPTPQEVRVTLRDNFTIEVNPSTIRPGRVRITIENQGAMTHGFGIEELPLEQFVAPSGSTFREDNMIAGTLTLYCPVADHRDRGMQTQLKVQ